MEAIMDSSKGNIEVVVPETGNPVERKILIKLIQDAIRDHRVPVLGRDGPATEAHYYLFDNELPINGWFRAVIDVERTGVEWPFDANQIRGRLAVVLYGTGDPHVVFSTDDRNGHYRPERGRIDGSLNPLLTLADFGMSEG